MKIRIKDYHILWLIIPCFFITNSLISNYKEIRIKEIEYNIKVIQLDSMKLSKDTTYINIKK